MKKLLYEEPSAEMLLYKEDIIRTSNGYDTPDDDDFGDFGDSNRGW